MQFFSTLIDISFAPPWRCRTVCGRPDRRFHAKLLTPLMFICSSAHFLDFQGFEPKTSAHSFLEMGGWKPPQSLVAQGNERMSGWT